MKQLPAGSIGESGSGVGEVWERVRAAVGRALQDDESRAEAQLRAETAAHGCALLSSCQRGEEVRVSGRVRSVTTRPLGGAPLLEAEIDDGSGSVRVLWLGRRRIGGIEVGRHLSVAGRLTSHEGRPAIFNARYELHPYELHRSY